MKKENSVLEHLPVHENRAFVAAWNARIGDDYDASAFLAFCPEILYTMFETEIAEI